MDWMQRDRVLKYRKFYVQKVKRENSEIISNWGVYSGLDCMSMVDDMDAPEEMFAMNIGEARVYPLQRWSGEESVWIKTRKMPDSTPLPVYPTFKESIINWFLTCPIDILRKQKHSF